MYSLPASYCVKLCQLLSIRTDKPSARFLGERDEKYDTYISLSIIVQPMLPLEAIVIANLAQKRENAGYEIK